MPSRVGVRGGGNRKRVVNPVDIENKTDLSATEFVNKLSLTYEVTFVTREQSKENWLLNLILKVVKLQAKINITLKAAM